MSKKQFNIMDKVNLTGGFKSLIDSSVQMEQLETIKTTKANPLNQGVRATFVVEAEVLEKIKGIAYWERLKIQDIVNLAFKNEIQNYESKNGEIKSIGK